MQLRSIGMYSVIAAVAAFAFCETGSAQTTVQLPSFNSFSYSGSVWVPTGGSTSLGGVSRSASSRSSRRGAGRAFGGGVDHAGARAHVTIIDNDAIDRQIRGLPPKRDVGSAVGRSLPRTSPLTEAERKRRDASVYDPDSEGKTLVRFARKQYLAGKHASAYDAYQLAIDSLSPKLAGLANAEFQRVFPAKQRPIHFLPNQLAVKKPADVSDQQ